MRKSHHYDVSIIHLVKNVWDKDRKDRTISLNATFIILFKNPSHMSQISHLDKQVYLSGNGLFRAAYRDATTTRAHGYMVIDFHQAISEKFRLRSTLYSDEDFPEALACGPTSKPWTGRWTSNVGYKDHPGVVVASFAASHSPWQQGTVQQDSATSCLPAVVGIANNSGSGRVAETTMTATAVARKHHRRCARAHPLGMNPCNLRRHVDAICILAKAQPTILAKAQLKVVKQLEASADKDLINHLLECTANIPNGNMILQPHQEQPLSRHGDALQTLDRQWVLLWSLTDGQQLRGPDASLA